MFDEPLETFADDDRGRIGLLGLLVVVGIVLLVFPEPVTSGIGGVVLVAALLLYLL